LAEVISFAHKMTSQITIIYHGYTDCNKGDCVQNSSNFHSCFIEFLGVICVTNSQCCICLIYLCCDLNVSMITFQQHVFLEVAEHTVAVAVSICAELRSYELSVEILCAF